MKVALINQPWEHVHPQGAKKASLVIWTYKVARLLKSSCEVVIYSRGHRRVGMDHTQEDGIDYRYIPTGLNTLLNKAHGLALKGIRLFRRGPRWQQRPRFCALFSNFGYALLVALDLRKQGCDVAHIHNFSQFVPVIRALNPGIKIVLHMNCEWLTQPDPRLIEPRLARTDKIIASSDFLTNNIRATYPRVADRCATIFNGVDVDLADGARARPLDPERIQLLYAGRVSPEKGVHVLIEAFEVLAPAYPTLYLDLVGSKRSVPLEYLEGLDDNARVADLKRFYTRSYIAQLEEQLSPDAARRVTFVGPIPHDQLLQRYQTSDLFLFPSVWDEPFGMPPVEAMAAGVPVVGTRSGGIVETVAHGETGLLVEPGDAPALTAAIRCLLDDVSLRTRMGAAGRQRARALFAWEQIAKEALAVYREVCGVPAPEVSTEPVLQA